MVEELLDPEAENEQPDSTQIYAEVAREGIEEMERPTSSLLWSGIAAGLLISMSLLFKAVLRHETTDIPAAHVIEAFGYTFGFVLVIFARLQLFTENTISPVLPTIAVPSFRNIRNLGRVWVASLAGNLVGTCIIALLFAKTTMITPETLKAMLEISHHVKDIGFMDSLLKGIPAGLLIAALVWMRPSAGGSFLGLVILVTYLIAIADFTHVIVGSCEIFLLAWSGEGKIVDMMAMNIFPTLIGNLIGGTGLFAVISWAQIRSEVAGPVRLLRKKAFAKEKGED